LLTVLGGPAFRLTYPNGDRAAYVSAVYEARVVGGTPRPDRGETLEVAWFDPADLGSADLGDYARSTFRALGLL
jgi:ADP-ribose pyrophosphatase YjhB (NUDIX family)